MSHATFRTASALVRAWEAWQRIDADPEPYVRRIIFNAYASWWQRRWRGERPTAEFADVSDGADPQLRLDDRDLLWRAMSRLPRRQRAVLILRYFEDIRGRGGRHPRLFGRHRQESGQPRRGQTSPRRGLHRGGGAAVNLTDLKQIMDERSTNAPDYVVHHARLLGVRTRLVARRRQRLTMWTACLVAALVGLTTAVVVERQCHTTTVPVFPIPLRFIEGFPEYAEGARVVAAKSARLPTDRIELTFTPSTRDLVMFVRCDTNDIVPRLAFTLSVNGRDFPVLFRAPALRG